MKKRVQQPSDPTKRVCVVCLEEKPLDGGFYQAKPGSPNFKTYGCAMPCKECNRARCRGYQRSEAQRARDAARAKRPEVVEQSRRRAAEWYATERGKEWIRAYGAKRYAEHGEAMRAKNRERYHSDPRMREMGRLYNQKRRARPEVRQAKNAAHSAYKKTERGRLLSRMHRQIRRARLASTVCDLTDHQWLALVNAYGARCAYCTKQAPMQIDHIQAVALGGDHTLRNVVPACKRCNQVKGALPLPEALQKLNVTRVNFLKRQGLALFAMIQGDI